MKNLLFAINGAVSISLYFINTVLWFMPIMLVSLLKLLPVQAWRKSMSIIADQCASAWISINRINQELFSRTHFVLKHEPELPIDNWYLVIANHQSWVDILVLQRIFNRKIPFLKFFLKHNLIYVPFLGLVWWGLDFPFMKRYSKAQILNNPSLKGKDLETTKRACKKYENTPVSIMNFVEGTRFNKRKMDKSNNKASALQHTLAPKSGGIAFVLSAMGERLSKLIDVTICYPEGIPSYWDFVCGKVNRIVIDINVIDIDHLHKENNFSDNYFNDMQQRQDFQNWLNKLWQDKDKKLQTMIKEG